MGKGTDLIQDEKDKFRTSSMRGERKPEEIEADIEQTLEGLEGTMDEIKEKFSKEHIKSQVRDATVGRAKRLFRTTGEKARHLGSDVMEGVRANPVGRTVTDNPIPAALVGIGLGWLIVKGFTRSNGRYQRSEEFEASEGFEADFESDEMCQAEMEQPAEGFERSKGTAAETLSRAKAKAGEMVGQAKEKASQLRAGASHQADALKERYQHTLENTPLALLGAAFVIGLAVGFSIPETKSEHGLMGKTKDRLLRKAKEMARGNMEKVEHVAMEAKRSATEKAKEEGLLS